MKEVGKHVVPWPVLIDVSAFKEVTFLLNTTTAQTKSKMVDVEGDDGGKELVVKWTDGMLKHTRSFKIKLKMRLVTEPMGLLECCSNSLGALRDACPDGEEGLRATLADLNDRLASFQSSPETQADEGRIVRGVVEEINVVRVVAMNKLQMIKSCLSAEDERSSL